MKHSILIIEPSEIIYKGLAEIINSNTTFDVLQQISAIENIDNALVALKPDVVLINPTLLPIHRHETGKPFNDILPDTPVVALVYQYIESDLLQHYDAVIDIRDSAAKTARILTTTYTNSSQEDNTESSELSEREKDVLILIAKGFISKEIADTLNISVHTVISHRKNITRKTGIKSIAGLVAYAMLNNLIDSNDIE